MSDNNEGGDVIVVPLTLYRHMQALWRLLLVTHGVTGICLGLTSYLRPPDDRNPSFATLKHIPGWPLAWATWVLLAGVLVLVGMRVRRGDLCRWGLLAMSTWTTTMILGYLSATVLHDGAAWQIPLYVGLTFCYAIHAAYLHEGDLP